MSESNLIYKNYEIGSFDLTEDRVAWLDHDGKKGFMIYSQIQSIKLGSVDVSSGPRMGQASLVDEQGDTLIKATSGTPASDDTNARAILWEMKLKSAYDDVTIQLNLAVNDNPESFRGFVQALHEKVANTNTSVDFMRGDSFTLVIFVVITVILLILSGGMVFGGNATGLLFLNWIGSAIAVAAIGLFVFGLKKSKAEPKSYDPLNIPDDLLPD